MTDEQQVANATRAHIEAFNREDVDRMVAMMSDDAIAMPPHQAALKGAEEISGWMREGFATARSQFDYTPVSTLVEGNLGVDHFDFTMTTTMNDSGEKIADEGNCIWVWRREADGDWHICRSIWNSKLEQPTVWSGAPRK